MMHQDFMDSEWFVPEPDNWHLKPGAPKEIVDAFNAYMHQQEESMSQGIILD